MTALYYITTFHNFVQTKTMASPHIYLPIDLTQLFDLVMQLPAKEKKKLIGLLKDEQESGATIAEEHKQIVRERIVKYAASPEQLIDWSEVQNMINTEDGNL
jgi:hypothetical protein